MKVTQTYDARIEHSQAEDLTPAPNKTPDAAGGAQNTVSGHNQGSNPAGGSPTDGIRETSAPGSKSAEFEAEVNERLGADPDYQKLEAKLAALKSFEEDFATIDGAIIFGRDDGIITLNELKDIAADVHQSPAAREAARRLLSNKSLWNEVASGATGKNDNRIGIDDVGRLIGATSDAMAAKRNAVRDELKAEKNPSSGSQAGTPAPGSTGVESTIPPPAPSSLPGMDGALENLANTGDHLQAQMMALAEEAAKDPSKATLNGQKIAMLQNKFQAITNMMNQLTQMISNMSKMWSDVAMNSIRNLR